jgi:tetratricopeptide (TPR) repeat protein
LRPVATPVPEVRPSAAPDRALAAALAAGALAVYAAGACRTIYVGDSGELVAAVHTLGIPHPSGYPLYVLAGKLWTVLLPIGSVAFRMSLFSALCAALAVGLVYLAARALEAGRAVAAAAALLFAASPSFWGEANVQRVYALNACFVALATLLAIRWDVAVSEGKDVHRRERLFVVIALVCGIGASNHTFLAVWGALFLLFALVRDRRLVRRWRTLLAAAVAALAGLSIYGFLFFRSRQEPRLDWGDPETPGALWAVVTRRDFWPRRWLSDPGDLLPIARDFFSSFAVELTWVGAALALAGLLAGLGRGRRPTVALLALVALGNAAALAAHGSRSDLFLWHRYYIPAYLSAALLAAVGLEAVVRRLRPRWSARAATALGALALVGAVALVPLRFREFDRGRYRIAEDYSRMLLGALPPGAHLAASDDNILFVLIYLQLVEGLRPDVDLILQGVGGELPPLRFDPDREPLFFTHHPNWRHPALDVVPVGLVYRVARAGAPAPPLLLPPRDRLEGEDDPRVPKDYLTRNLVGELHFMLGVTYESRDRARALAELERAALAAPDNDVLFYNLGLVYERLALPERALAAFERSAAINPREIPGPSRARAAERVEALRRRLGRPPA